VSGSSTIGVGAGGDAPDAPMRRRRSAPAVWQPRQPVFWLMAVLTAVGIVLVVAGRIVSADSAPVFVAAVLFVGVQAVLLWLIVRAIPRFRRQPGSLMAAGLVWGGVVAVPLAGSLNAVNLGALSSFGIDSFAASITAPLNEDLLRLLGVLVVLVLAYRRPLTVMDGVVYGFIVGAGFELMENLSYGLDAGNLDEAIGTGLKRLLLGFALHALWTASAGAVLAYCLSRAQRGFGGRWLLLVPAIALPMLLHAGWDSPSPSVLAEMQLLVQLLVYALTLALFFIAVVWGRRSEYAWFAESAGSALTRAEFRRLPRAERRTLARAAVDGEARSRIADGVPEQAGVRIE
jgi:RsiW-degrading membrane proteinase PrsW (M82 family)